MPTPTRITSKPTITTQARPPRVNIAAQEQVQRLREIRRSQEERNVNLRRDETVEKEAAQTKSYQQISTEADKFNRAQSDLQTTGKKYNELVEKYNATSDEKQRAKLESEISQTASNYNKLHDIVSRQALKYNAYVESSKLSGVVPKSTEGIKYTGEKIDDPFAYRKTTEYASVMKSSSDVESTKNLLTSVEQRYNILVSQYNAADPASQAKLESDIMSAAEEYNRVSGMLSQQVSRYNSALLTAQSKGVVSQDTKPISYTQSQITPKYTEETTRTQDQPIPLSTPTQYQTQKTKPSSFDIGKSAALGFAAFTAGAAKVATTAIPAFLVDKQKTVSEDPKLASISQFPIIDVGKSLGAFATVAKTVQKSPSDTETELDASLRVRNMGLIDTGKAILNIGIAGATYAQRTEQLTPTISITTAASPIMKTIGSGYIAVGQDLEKSRVYFSEGMISSKDGQLKYNDPGLLTSVAFGLATAGVGGIVTKGIATTGGLALPRIFQAGGGKTAETFISTSGRGFASGGGGIAALSTEQAATVAMKLASAGAAIGATIRTPSKTTTAQPSQVTTTSDINVPIDDYADLYRAWGERGGTKKKIVSKQSEGFSLQPSTRTSDINTLESIDITKTPQSVRVRTAESYAYSSMPEINIDREFERFTPEITIFDTPGRSQYRKQEEDINKEENIYREMNSIRMDFPYDYQYPSANDFSIRTRKLPDIPDSEKTSKKRKRRSSRNTGEYRFISNYLPTAKDLFGKRRKSKSKSSDDLLTMRKRK